MLKMSDRRWEPGASKTRFKNLLSQSRQLSILCFYLGDGGMSMVETLAEDTVADSTWEMAPLNTAIARAREGPQVGKMDGEK